MSSATAGRSGMAFLESSEIAILISWPMGCVGLMGAFIDLSFSFNAAPHTRSGRWGAQFSQTTWPQEIVGKEEIRAYWTRQWGEFDPYVEPLAMTEEDGGEIRVRVHQLVKSLQGDVLSDSEVLHMFTVKSSIIAAMDLGDEADPSAGPSAAFAHRS